VTVFLSGDVMTGRGVDQILPHPSGHQIFEPYVRDAREYVRLAESHSGPIERPVPGRYIWGDALAELDRVAPDVRIVNLETSVTTSSEPCRGKDIHYRMHPGNIDCLTAARLDVCTLANNHVLDFGHAGLIESLDSLARAGLKTAGAGRTLSEAQAPALASLPAGGRVIVFSLGASSSGIPRDWAAGVDRPGLDVLVDLSDRTAAATIERIRQAKDEGDIVVASIHWGTNWGYDVPYDHVRFARRLVDGGVDIVHGHSSHHPRPIEVYQGRLILYGCGDFFNDYEGIEGYERYRDDLVLMYFATLSVATGALTDLRMRPLRIRRLSLERTADVDSQWLGETLDRISAPFGSHVDVTADGMLALRWTQPLPGRRRSRV